MITTYPEEDGHGHVRHNNFGNNPEPIRLMCCCVYVKLSFSVSP